MPLQTFIDPESQRPRPIGEFVDWFRQVWSDPSGHDYQFLRYVAPQIRLLAPLAGRSCGREQGYAAFRRAFAVLPDLTATVTEWAVSEDALFIAMEFRATVGRRAIRWRNVDRFVFRDGSAVERRAFFNPLTLMGSMLTSPRTLYRYLRSRVGRAPSGWPARRTIAPRRG